MILNALFKRVVTNYITGLNSHAKIMSQKSILSFFQKQPIKTTPAELETVKHPTITKEEDEALLETNVNKSPGIKKKRKRINVASDSEEETTKISPEKKKRSVEPSVKILDSVNEANVFKKINQELEQKEEESEVKENSIHQDENETSDQAIKVNGNEISDQEIEENGVNTEIAEEKPVLRTLSFLGSKKRQTKTPKKTTAGKKTKITDEDKQTSKKTPAKSKTSDKKSPKVSPVVKKSGKDEKVEVKNEDVESPDENENKSDLDSLKISKENISKAFLINKTTEVEKETKKTDQNKPTNKKTPSKSKTNKKRNSQSPVVQKKEKDEKVEEQKEDVESPDENKNKSNLDSFKISKESISKAFLTNKTTEVEKETKKTDDDKQTSKKTPAKSKTSSKKSPKISPAMKKSGKEEKNEDVDSPEEEKNKSDLDDSKISKKNESKEFLINKTLSGTSSKTDYFPDKKNYHPIEDASWKRGERVPYLALAKTLQKIEEISARLKIVEILSNYLRSVIVLSEEDLLPSIYLCLNRLAPAYEGLELGIADTYLMKAIAQCTGRTLAQIKADVTSTGDLGIVAEQSRSNQRIMFRPAPLTVQSVFNQLTTIAKISGNSAMSKKIDKIEALFVACRECEARFVIRSLAGKMRIGLAEQSVLQALAVACTTTPLNQEYPPEILNASKGISADEFKKKCDENALALKTTFCECPSYNMIIPVLLEDGIKGLPEKCKITPGLPVKPMLAQPTKGAREVLERFDGMKFTCEWKYDGERAQIHLTEDGQIKIYSRNQENNTSKYPDIISNLNELITPELKSFILDTEAVAWDREQKKIMPFQVLSTRKRKDASESEIKVQVCVYMFDLLYLNGISLVQKPLIERRQLLHEHFQEVEGKFVYVTSLDTNTMEEVQECLEESVKGNCEGLMVKTLDTEATYEIAKRSRNWLKLKKDYLEGVGDTLDLVVIGGYTGKGKRTGQYGGFLLASYDVDNEEYQAICKIGTGFTDEILVQHTEFLKQHIIPEAKSYYRYDAGLKPDHWFDAVQVWEVKCADLSLSPVYYSAIGLVDPEKGISLRFPRFLRIREDKSVEQATSSQQVAELYQNQDQIKNQGNVNSFNEEDF